MTTKRRLVAFALLLSVPVVGARAQNPEPEPEPEEPSSPIVTTGLTAGQLRFPDGHVQQGASMVLRWHPYPGVAIAATPSYTRVRQPSSLGGAASQGLSDIPVEFAVDQPVPAPMSPTVGVGIIMTVPVGDTATGLGSGKVGTSFALGVGFAPSKRLSMHFGAGRPMSDFSTNGALGGSNSTWGDAEAAYRLSERLGTTFGLDADLAADSGAVPGRTLVAGMSYALRGPLTLTVNAGHGVSGDAARWSFSLGIGTDFADLAELGSTSMVRRAVTALGGHSQTHGGWSKRPTDPGNGNGNGKP